MSNKRQIELDVLRGIAILLVIICHTSPRPAGAGGFQILEKVVNFLFGGGWVGVDIFFVLSGFLVGGLLFKEVKDTGKVDILRFLIRRGFKIYPAFLFFTAVSFALPISYNPPTSMGLVCDLFYLQSYCPGIHGHSWSLSVEEHFYWLLAFLILFLVKKRSIHSIPRIVAFTSVICLIMRIITAIVIPYGWITHSSPTHLRIDSLAFGLLIAYYFHFSNSKLISVASRFKWLLLGGGILALLPPFFLTPIRNFPFIYTVGYTTNYLGAGMLLTALLVNRIPPNFFTRIMAYIGFQSYSIYLWHGSFNFFAIPFLVEAGLLPTLSSDSHFFAYLSGSILLGIFMALYIEKPFLKIRDWIIPATKVN
ncbi:MAG: acyltransferase [Leptolinea sp.]|jgi:peptidoglycan/LPS O-acetylase OafA/YrhL|nr:acyltransferase [Leptolinea sp.]